MLRDVVIYRFQLILYITQGFHLRILVKNI